MEKFVQDIFVDFSSVKNWNNIVEQCYFDQCLLIVNFLI